MIVRGFEIRNLVQVPSDKHMAGYTFTFEAYRRGEWHTYGPQVLGNWSIASYIEKEILPRFTTEDMPEDMSTIPIGWWVLDAALADQTKL